MTSNNNGMTTSSTTNNTTENNNTTNNGDNNNNVEYYKFNFGKLPPKLFDPNVPADKWLDLCETTTNKNGFPSCSLNEIDTISWDVELERLIGISLYMFGNVLPFLVPTFCILFFVCGIYGQVIVVLCMGYFCLLGSIEAFVSLPYFVFFKYKQKAYLTGNIRQDQYEFSQWNQCQYISAKYVWPKSMHRPRLENQPVIFCMVPHGVAPLGCTGYSVWSKLWNDQICRWTIAPIVLQLPLVGYFCTKLGCIPAKSNHIFKALQRQENVGIALDGIEGMFQQSRHEEKAHLLKRKGVIKIALRAGVPIVPVYGFGHTSLWNILVDPFGVLEWLSIQCGASITPFFGRYCWPLGPPHRVPVTVCLGHPIVLARDEKTQKKPAVVSNPTQQQIDEGHAKLLEGFQTLFDTHKGAYGWSHKQLKFV